MDELGPTPRIAASEEKPGDQIDRYRLMRLIGEGAWGTVWEAEQTEPIQRRVALKILKLGLDTKDFLDRFNAERQMMAILDHPGITVIHDAGATDFGRPFLVMELVDGLPLLQYADEKCLTIEERVKLYIQVCKAVHHAHLQGIIHRDIKPSNILITEEGGVPRPKIIDFGIAKSNQYQVSEKTLFTNIHTFLGTPLYSSPEQLEFCGMEVDPRSDVYSLGALLYQLLVGRTLFDLQSISYEGKDRLRRVLMEEDPPRPSTRFAGLDKEEQAALATKRKLAPARVVTQLRGDLDWIVMKCLEKDRSRRFDSTRFLAGDLKAYLDYQPVSAAAPSLAYRTGKFFKRHGLRSGPQWYSAGVVLLLVGVSLYFLGKRAGTVLDRSSLLQSSGRPLPSATSQSALAVIPFENLSQASADAYLDESVYSEMMASLGRRGDFSLISQTAILASPFSHKSALELGRELAADFLLTGTVEKLEQEVRLTVQLLKVADGTSVWSNRYARTIEPGTLFNLQADLCRLVSIKVSSLLKPDEQRVDRTVPTQNLEALEAYWEAKEIVERDVGARMGEAVELLKRAIELDPEFTLAYVMLGHAYNNDYLADVLEISLEERISELDSLTAKALDLDDTLPEVHVLDGIKQMRAHDREKAVGAFRRALELDPDHADAVYYETRYETALRSSDPEFKQKLEQRLVRFERAIELDPKKAEFRFHVARVLKLLSRRDEMLTHYQAAADHNPESYMAQNWLALHYSGVYSRFDQAIFYLRKAFALLPTDSHFAANIRGMYFLLGDVDEAIRWTLVEKQVAEQLAPLYDANFLYFTGQKEKAVQSFRDVKAFYDLTQPEEKAIQAYRDVMAFYDRTQPTGYMEGRRILFNYDLRNKNLNQALDRYRELAPELFKEAPRMRHSSSKMALEIAALLQAHDEEIRAAQLIDKTMDLLLQAAPSAERYFMQSLGFSLQKNRAAAMQALGDAVEKGFRDRTRLEDARLDPWREDPKFQSIMDVVEHDMAEQLANLRQMEARGDLAPISEHILSGLEDPRK